MRTTLNPIVQREGYSAPFERELLDYLAETLFNPIRDVLPRITRNNARAEERHSALWDALVAGTVWYAQGVFSGSFNSAISRELRAIGASKHAHGFTIDPDEVPIALRGVIAVSVQRGIATHEALLTTIDQVIEHLERAASGLSFSNPVDKLVSGLQEQFVETVSSVEGLPLPSPVSEGLTEELKVRSTLEIDKAIKNFSVEATEKLRERVRRNLCEGGRMDRLADLVETEFGVARRKAQFLADQETSILVSEFRKQRYQELGCTEYIWETVGDGRVRPTHGESNNHRVLNGRKFSWGAPPVVDTATGRRCHPGEDFGPCRCVARPVIKFAE